MKVAVVGGGSTYTPELVDGLLRRREVLGVDHIALVDPDAGRLDVVGRLTERMCARAGGGIEVTWGPDLPGGVSGATFVVSQIRVGGQAARDRDELLGREFGLIGQETVGVGGLANALRTVPVAFDIADAIAAESPDAVLFNFTNPSGLITEALCRHRPHVTTIGLCNVPWTVTAAISAAFGTTPERIDLDYVGLNHLSWIRRIGIDGVDRTDDVLSGLRALVAAKPSGDEAHADPPDWTPESLDLLAAIPNQYLLYYYETEAFLAHQAAGPTRASEVMAIDAALLERYADPELAEKPPELAQRGGSHYSEAATALMADLWSDAGSVHVVNTVNRGAITELPDDVVVEVPARIHRDRVQTIPQAPLRPDIAALTTTVKSFELLAVQAAVEGDAIAAKRALLTNPLGPPAHEVEMVWARLTEVHAGLLGRLG